MGLLDNISKVASSLNPVVGIANAVSSIANGFFDRHEQKESNKRNAEQNELNREFNAVEAEKNRQFQSAEAAKQNAFNAAQSQLAFDRSARFQQEMWQKENEYNTPLAQIKRLEQAGINPNLFGGDNTAGSAGSAVSPAASGSAPSGSAASVGSSIPNQPISYVNPLLEASQIRLANAQAKLAENDAERTSELLPYEIETAEANIRVANSNVNLNDAKAQNLASSTRLNDQKVQESKETVTFMEMDEKEKQFNIDRLYERWMMEVHEFNQRIIESDSRIKLAKGQINELVSRACLNYAQAQNAQDIHLLNGLELHFVNGMSDANKDYYCRMRWDAELGKYEVDLDSQETEKVSNKRTRQRASRRNEDTIYNTILDYVSDLDDALGRPFGAGFHFGYRRTSND